MRRKSINQLRDELRQAEAELEAATKLSEVKAAAKRLQRAKAELKAAEEKPSGDG